MSGFSLDWLALREGADDAARDAGLRRAFLDALPASPHILDLGSGTGATARALGIAEARWTLVDHDAALLEEAARRNPGATVRRADLARDLEEVLATDADAVTASALFDLVSPGWIDRFAAGVNAPVIYAALSYDGTEKWLPEHPDDEAVMRAFDAHQRGDKGFGPAAGPMGAALLARALEGRGYAVSLARSPWQLDRAADAALMDALAGGIAQAAGEAGCDVAQEWRRARAAAARCTIGHIDLLALRG